MRGFLRLFVTSVRVGKVFKFRERTQKSLLMRCEPTENCTGKINQRGGTRANPAAEGAGPARRHRLQTEGRAILHAAAPRTDTTLTSCGHTRHDTWASPKPTRTCAHSNTPTVCHCCGRPLGNVTWFPPHKPTVFAPWKQKRGGCGGTEGHACRPGARL